MKRIVKIFIFVFSYLINMIIPSPNVSSMYRRQYPYYDINEIMGTSPDKINLNIEKEKLPNLHEYRELREKLPNHTNDDYKFCAIFNTTNFNFFLDVIKYTILDYIKNGKKISEIDSGPKLSNIIVERLNRGTMSQGTMSSEYKLGFPQITNVCVRNQPGPFGNGALLIPCFNLEYDKNKKKIILNFVNKYENDNDETQNECLKYDEEDVYKVEITDISPNSNDQRFTYKVWNEKGRLEEKKNPCGYYGYKS